MEAVLDVKGKEMVLTVVDHKNGQYDLLYPPLAYPGTYEVEIKVQVPGVPYMVGLPDSPFDLEIGTPPAATSQSINWDIIYQI